MRFVECFWSSEMIVLKSFTWGESNCCFNCFCVAFGLYERAKYRATKRDICCGCCGVKAFVRLLIVSLFHPVIRSEHGTFPLCCSRCLILAFAWIWSTFESSISVFWFWNNTWFHRPIPSAPEVRKYWTHNKENSLYNIQYLLCKYLVLEKSSLSCSLGLHREKKSIFISMYTRYVYT